MLGIHRVVFDRWVEPEAVAISLAVVEGCLKIFASPAATATASPTPAFGPVSACPPGAFALLALVTIFVYLGLFLIVLFGFLGRSSLDLGLDLIPKVDFAGRRVLLVGREPVLFAELAKLAGADFELVGYPGIGTPLADPGADLIELWLK
jgi:hypothetical protein